MAEINIAGENFNVLVEGDETKPAVLLVNGLGTSLHMWDAQVPGLLKEFRVVRYDGRGHGASVVAEGPYSIESLAKDALAILDALDISKAHFIGLSMGGFIGQWILCHAPERIGRAVLANTGAHIGSPDLWNSRINKIRESGLAAVAGNVVERWFSKDFREAHPEVIAPVADVLKQTSVEGYASACAALRDADLREAVRSIKAKVLVIVSTYDAATPPELGEYLAQVIDGAKLVTLETGHLSNVEDPRHFTEAVIEFLTAPETALPATTPALANASRRPRPVKRTVGTPVPQPTGLITVAAKKAPSKTATGTPVKTAPAPKAAVVVSLPVNKKPAAKTAVASPAPAPQKPAAKTVITKTPAKAAPAAKAATPRGAAPVSASKAPATKASAAKAPAQKAVAEKAVTAKTAAARGTSAKAAAAKTIAAAKPAAKKTAAPAPVAKLAAAKGAPVKKAAAPSTAPKAAAAKTTVSKLTVAPKATPAKPAAAKSPAPKTAAVKAPAPKAAAAKAAPVKTPAKKTAPSKAATSKPVSRPAR